MSLFLTSRQKIREVEVEVLNPGGVGGFVLREAVTMGPPAPRKVEPTPQPLEAVKVERAAEPIDAVDPEPADADEAVFAPQPSATELTCEIVFWRGYRKSAFYARVFDDAGEPLAVAESSFFRSSGNGSPDATDAAESAYDDLCERLERDGWNWVDQGSTWYGDVFQRDVTVAAEPEPE